METKVLCPVVSEIVLINDVNIDDLLIYQELMPLLKKPHLIKVTNADDCTLLLYDEIKSCLDNETLFIFPGKGAEDFRSRIEILDVNFALALNVPAKRFWRPGSKPRVEITWPDIISFRYIKRVIVCDDVISSGETILSLKETAPDFLQSLPWRLYTWILKNSSKRRLNKEFESCFAVYVAKRLSGRLFIISISTLIKKKEILHSFVEEYANNKEGLLSVMRKIV